MSLTIPKDVYECDGTESEFPITFPFGTQADVFAFLIHEESGAYRRLVRDQDYTVETADNGTSFVRTRVDDFRDPWPVGYTLTILRRRQYRQASSQAMTPVVFRHRLEHLTQLCQQLREQLDRTLHVGTRYPDLDLTSKVYAGEFDSGGATLTMAPYFGTFMPVVTGSHGTMGTLTMLGGTIIAPVLYYLDWPVEEAEMGTMELLEGSLVDGDPPPNIITYEDWPIEEAEMLGLEMLDGTIIAPVVHYDDWPIEEAEVVSLILTGGSLA